MCLVLTFVVLINVCGEFKYHGNPYIIIQGPAILVPDDVTAHAQYFCQRKIRATRVRALS